MLKRTHTKRWQAAGTMRAEKVLIVCDRGTVDNKAYMNELKFSQVP